MERLIKEGHYSRGDTIFHPLFSYGETIKGENHGPDKSEIFLNKQTTSKLTV
jgi:hypothetical protein